MVRRVKFSLRGECKRKEKAEKISLNFPHRENCCFPITMKNNIFISTWISYPLRSWYVFARAISNQTTVNLEVTVFSQAKHKISESCYLKHQKIDCDISLYGHLSFLSQIDTTNFLWNDKIMYQNMISEIHFGFHQRLKSIKNKSFRM